MSGYALGASKVVIKYDVRHDLAKEMAVSILEDEYQYSTLYSGSDDKEKMRHRYEDARAVISLEDSGFLPEEIKAILKGAAQHREFLVSAFGQPEKWGIREILVFTLKGMRVLKTEEAIVGSMQDSIKSLSSRNQEDWLELGDDIVEQGASADKFFQLVDPINRVEVLRRELMNELVVYFGPDLAIGEDPVKITQAIRGFMPVVINQSKFVLDRAWNNQYGNRSSLEIQEEFTRRKGIEDSKRDKALEELTERFLSLHYLPRFSTDLEREFGRDSMYRALNAERRIAYPLLDSARLTRTVRS